LTPTRRIVAHDARFHLQALAWFRYAHCVAERCRISVEAASTHGRMAEMHQQMMGMMGGRGMMNAR
jgi:hypothetical protein